MRPVTRAVLVGALSVASVAAVAACHRRGEHEGPRHGGRVGDGDGDLDRDHDEGHDESHEGMDGSIRGAKGETKSAAKHIASARCEREARCNNIGADKKFASSDNCEDSIRSEWAQDLNAYDCPKGVVENELNECLTAIRDEDCNSPFDTLGRVSACTAGQICAD